MTDHEAFIAHLKTVSAEVRTWPKWKQEAMGGTYQPPQDQNMLDLLKKLLDLKALLGSAYFADLQAIALAALARDWKQVVHLSFALAEKVATEHLFPTPMMTAAPVSESELDATLKELETGTVVTVTGAEAVAISPGEIIAIVTLIADLVKLWRNRKVS